MQRLSTDLKNRMRISKQFTIPTHTSMLLCTHIPSGGDGHSTPTLKKSFIFHLLYLSTLISLSLWMQRVISSPMVIPHNVLWQNKTHLSVASSPQAIVPTHITAKLLWLQAAVLKQPSKQINTSSLCNTNAPTPN